ncbi:hypothetical protein [Arenicella xantha]|uniref:Uncharacterized protein n=1 Tax=Arenicella xantha TaxID=644221 RepID=A0A395JGV1_9GAMM|nr:hypothetical protein [Arenicella xantha]RBP48665.1 hypothetical protein DFR28_1053 [Arenicella xantha]
MKPGIHPLQSESFDLIEKLYSQLALPMTKAMIDVQRRYYPSIGSILKTLDYYSEHEIVIAFREEHNLLITKTLEELKKDESKANEDPADGVFGDMFADIFDHVNVAKILKTFSIQEIENVFSESLSKLSGVSLKVGIIQIQNFDDYCSGEVEVSLKVVEGEKKS